MWGDNVAVLRKEMLLILRKLSYRMEYTKGALGCGGNEFSSEGSREDGE